MTILAKLTVLSAALVCFIAFSSASELRQVNDVRAGDLPDSLPAFDQLIELPQFHSDKVQPDQESAVVPELPESTESTEELTPITFRPEDHHHGQFKPKELSFGDDMILSSDDKGSDEAEEQKPERWVKFHHHHGKPKFGDRSEMREMEGESDDVRRPHHHHHHHHLSFDREDADEKESRRSRHHHRFDRDEDEEKEGRHRHGEHHHHRFDRDEDEEKEGRHRHGEHHHHHHHLDEEDQNEEGGVLMKIRKFLM